MCAATTQMVSKVAELMELRKMIEDLTAEAELIADEIKAYMGEEETMTAGSYVVRYQNVVSQRSAQLPQINAGFLPGYSDF